MYIQTIIKVRPESAEEDRIIKQEAEIIDDIRPVLGDAPNKFPVYIVTSDQLKAIHSKLIKIRGSMG